MEVRAVDAAAVRPLRLRVLRPHQTLAEMAYPGDEEPLALHVAACDVGGPVAVATIAPGGHPAGAACGDWRIRGMATDPAYRGRGLGARLLARCLAHASAAGGGRVWCFARVGARSLYERAGFAAEGEVFDLEDIGPHLLMSRPLPAGTPRPDAPSSPPSAGG